MPLLLDLHFPDPRLPKLQPERRRRKKKWPEPEGYVAANVVPWLDLVVILEVGPFYRPLEAEKRRRAGETDAVLRVDEEGKVTIADVRKPESVEGRAMPDKASTYPAPTG